MTQFADVSYVQSTIDWSQYPFPIAVIKVNEGIGPEWIDPFFDANQRGALARGVQEIWYYHFARPSLNDPKQAANYFANVIGGMRPRDRIVLDLEVSGPDLPNWGHTWFQSLGYPNRKVLYSYQSFIDQFLINSPLCAYDLWEAVYTAQKPAAPAGWSNILAWQYTDAGSVPGITGKVDLSYFYGDIKMIPNGWTDDGVALHNPHNSNVVVRGFRDYILSHNWDPNDFPEENERAANPLEDSNTALGGGTQQIFRFSMLGWTASGGVFRESVGQELFKVRQELAALRSATANTKATVGQVISLLQPLS